MCNIHLTIISLRLVHYSNSDSWIRRLRIDIHFLGAQNCQHGCGGNLTIALNICWNTCKNPGDAIILEIEITDKNHVYTFLTTLFLPPHTNLCLLAHVTFVAWYWYLNFRLCLEEMLFQITVRIYVSLFGSFGQTLVRFFWPLKPPDPHFG